MKRIVREKSTFDMIDAFNKQIKDLEAQSLVESASWVDTNGMFGDPGATLTDKDLEDYWKVAHDDDPSLAEYDSYDAWANETKGFLTPVEGAEDVSDADGVYMFMYCAPGDGTASDDFSCMCKFKADSLEDANEQVANWVNKHYGEENISDYQYYADEYNDYFDDESEIFDKLDDYNSSIESSRICSSDDIDDSDDSFWEMIETKQVLDADGFSTEYTLYHNIADDTYGCIFGDRDFYRPEEGYFDWEGDNEAEALEWFHSYNGFEDEDLYGCDSITSSTDISLADDQLNELYEIAEAYCTSHPVSGEWDNEEDSEAQAIADHFAISLEEAESLMVNYLGFEPQEASVTGSTIADNGQEVFQLINYSSDPGAGMEGDEFYCYGEFFATDKQDAEAQLEDAKKTYPKFFDISYPYSSIYVDDYNEQFATGNEIYQNVSAIVQNIESPEIDPELPFN